ncbi:homeobox-DDT domain protein RLT3 isoform X2 [Jatropha curcas]|uniref:homeobox-DDT domain protein RLT3 isoform X2 n=1 Tax=Jatropha curcas TaxID=180498 RepID=UPI0018931A3A|nr:homeobox-DDT domain protein RLT3 isoform X2 [Jatropha curcas]
METKRKSPLQLQALEKFYAEQKYPTNSAMEELAAVLDLTFKQVQGWFVEKRRRDKSKNILITTPSVTTNRKKDKRRDTLIKHAYSGSASKSYKTKRKKNLFLLQDLLTPDYILRKIFRKDGPPLGAEFDSLPSRAFGNDEDSRDSGDVCQENQRANKRRKVPKQGILNYQDNSNSAPVMKHGIGKGLMTVWRATNPNSGDFPPGVHFADREIVPQISISVSRKPLHKKKKRQQLVSLMKQRRLENKSNHKKKPAVKRREVESKRDEFQKQPRKEKCELALEGVISPEQVNQFAMLVDDEELELRELQAGPNPITCSDHCASNGLHGCSLCKDLLPKFPPNSVRMKQPFAKQPWDSSPETVKKLFKVFHFLYTYSVAIDIYSFTLDEFAQAFHDKDSLLLGKIHVALLKLLLSDVETEISNGFLPHLSISCKFLALLHSVEDQTYIVDFWKKSLNPLTWTEILRQILVAAGFGSRQGALHREALSKEMTLMVKYGLRPGTLKGELFKLLLERGNNGLKVSELANSLQISELNLGSTTEELELLISSTLSSDITLFEKISPSAYRLRISTLSKETSDFESDTEDSGCVHDDFNDNGTCSSGDSECESDNSNSRKFKHANCKIIKNDMLTVHNEIDESQPGEVWLLGLMEGEYSDLSIEEKLNALVALIDLLSAGSSVRVEDGTKSIVESAPSVPHYGSGGKIKRSSKQLNLPRPSWVYTGQMNDPKEHTLPASRPIDSSMLIVKFNEREKSCGKLKDLKETEFLHSMQSIFLGSDRRFNRYWLFLGPCNSQDPGHKRVYFESSEDGHWEVVDTEEALRALLSILDDRGAREAHLIESLEKRETFLYQEMSSSMSNDAGNSNLTQSDQSGIEIVREVSTSPVSDVDNNLSMSGAIKDSLPSCSAIILEAGKKEEEENRKWSRLQELDKWIWNSFYCDLNAVKHSKRSYFESLTRCETCNDLYWRDEKHCRICHSTFELDFDLEERYAIHSATCREREDSEMFPKHKVLSSQLQSLKAAVHAIESAMPEDALLGAWTKSAHRLWVKRLRRTSSLAELLQAVADFVAGINEDWLCQLDVPQDSNTSMEEIIAFFPTMPQTSSALALWLVKFDDLISPYLKRVQGENNQETGSKCTGKKKCL